MLLHTNRMQPTHCPRCNAPQDAYSGPVTKAKPGDMCVCIRCGTVNHFDAQMRLQAMTREQIAAAVDADPDLACELARMQSAVFACMAIDAAKGKRS